MKMYVLDCGSFTIPRRFIVNDEAAQSDPNLTMVIPVACYLFDHPAGWLLFDAACDPDGFTKNWSDNFKAIPYSVENGMYFPQRLKEIGVSPEDIAYAVVSHLHNDHGGCLHLLQNASIYVNEAEYSTTLAHYQSGGDLNSHAPSDVRHWIEAGLRWELVPEAQKKLSPLDSVTIYNFGSGHAWGMLGMMVKMENTGNLLLVSDALYCATNQGPPVVLPGEAYVHDPAGYVRTVREIEKVAAEEKATVIFGHDLAQFQGLKKRSPIA